MCVRTFILSAENREIKRKDKVTVCGSAGGFFLSGTQHHLIKLCQRDTGTANNRSSCGRTPVLQLPLSPPSLLRHWWNGNSSDFSAQSHLQAHSRQYSSDLLSQDERQLFLSSTVTATACLFALDFLTFTRAALIRGFGRALLI